MLKIVLPRDRQLYENGLSVLMVVTLFWNSGYATIHCRYTNSNNANFYFYIITHLIILDVELVSPNV